MGKMSFEPEREERLEELIGGYPFRPARSSRAMSNCRSCLVFDHPTLVIPGRE
jgi:hypothetical protein